MSEINDLINKIVKEAGQQAPHSETTVPTKKADKQAGHTKMTAADYPLFKKHPEMVNAPNGKNINEITIEAAINGQVKPEDLRIAPATLKAQGEIAESAGRGALKSNFDRAAELTAIPDERLLEMYGALRPYRSTKEELLAIADELENKYNAKITAGFVREAVEMYGIRKKFKGDN
ncbi:diol dehydratase small subunit [Latilactobacillus curvatus]|uniref:Propanediol dehydratase n=1 Tax=Latilactobacillus curvatus TaxID=28038 RepID=A0AAC9UPT9_LATCU|nr:diol dehydratase small subunit [Latilactobacillus curvatus]ASN59240.1 propanediol dehydratase [Latilactobacillus curvatus]MDT3394124.1 diol dehydratase small subunit [Bacillota bacterium]QAR34672.1 diol dehydratase small subunit [Latilactobacillus curvatus]